MLRRSMVPAGCADFDFAAIMRRMIFFGAGSVHRKPAPALISVIRAHAEARRMNRPTSVFGFLFLLSISTPMSLLKNNFVVGVTAGLVASILAPIVLPMMKRSARPLAKTLVKGGMVAYEKGREAVATAGEMMEDVMAEVRAESPEMNMAADEEWQAEPASEKEKPAAHGGNGLSHGASAGNA